MSAENHRSLHNQRLHFRLLNSVFIPVVGMTGKETGSTDDAWERHGLFRCGAFIAARSHRPSINIRKSPPEHLPLTIAEAMRRSVVTHHRQLKIYSMTEVIWLDRPVIRGPPADRLVQARHPAVTDSAVRRST